MSKPFRFDSILRYRKQVADQAQIVYAAAAADLDQGLKELDTLYKSVDENYLETQKLRESGGAPSERLKTHDEFFAGQQIRIDRQRQKVRELKSKAEEAHEKLVACVVEYKSLEKLKERQEERVRTEEKKKYQAELDDIVTMRHGRESKA